MTRTFSLVIGSLLLTGCGEQKIAETYAAKMSDVLTSYRRQIDLKISAEQQSYSELAKAYDASAMNNSEQSLDLQRNQQATALVDEIQSRPGAPVFISSVQSRLQAYGEADFNEASQRFTREADAYKRALASLEDLSVEQTHLDNLSTALTTLAKPRSNIEQLKVLGQFGCDVNRNFQLLDLATEIKDLAKQDAAQKALKAAKTAELAALPPTTQDDRKKALQDEIKQIDAKLAVIAKQNTAALAEQTKLSTPCK
jgi:hypothetical protein